MRQIDATAEAFPETEDAAPPGPGLLSRIADLLWQWRHRAESRRWLALMDPHQLRDIGLSTEDRAAEVRKPFWMP